jgi:hypothetical protein
MEFNKHIIIMNILLGWEQKTQTNCEKTRFIVKQTKVRILRHFIAEFNAKTSLPEVIRPQTRLEEFNEQLWIDDEWDTLLEILYSLKPSRSDT